MPELSRVKAHTANLLNEQFDQDNNREVEGIVQKLKNDLAIFMGSDEEDKAEEKLGNIVSKAVKLNSYFLKSRAFFVTDWDTDDESDNFDDLIVRYKSGKQGGEPVVGVQISPRLSKIGNADGEFFKSTNAMVIYKPMVTLNYE
jgi:aspartyl/asparaginyl-tRNA synthetase